LVEHLQKLDIHWLSMHKIVYSLAELAWKLVTRWLIISQKLVTLWLSMRKNWLPESGRRAHGISLDSVCTKCI
jgi:hypothetical protein